MRVSSELVEGDGQLLLGGVAIPRLVATPSASAERAGRWPPVHALGLARPPSAAGAPGRTAASRRLLGRSVSAFDFGAR